jgi:two-component system nitrate/nitrite response regulator NarL
LVEGDSNKVIARKMKIADATVKVHIKTILRKIRVDNRTQAAIWAIRNNAIIMESRNAFSNPVNFRIGDTTALRDSISP